MSILKITGRIVATSIALFFHYSLILYYFWRDGYVETVDMLFSPFIILTAYWAGKQYDKATYFSEKDAHTNLYNRRFLQESFEKITALANRTNSKLFVIILDCDNFKSINDDFGHHAGDKALTRIADSILANTRKSDIVVRWGGDEFLIVGHFKDGSGLNTVLSRLEEGFAAQPIHEDEIAISVSMGSAIYPDHHIDMHELIKIADKNMYDQKIRNKMTKNQAR